MTTDNLEESGYGDANVGLFLMSGICDVIGQHLGVSVV